MRRHVRGYDLSKRPRTASSWFVLEVKRTPLLDSDADPVIAELLTEWTAANVAGEIIVGEPEKQTVINGALLELAKRRGGKVKQNDPEARCMLDKLGATALQKRAAFRALPEEHRHIAREGRPRS